MERRSTRYTQALILSLFISLPVLLPAQSIQLGAKGGFNLTTMFGDTYSNLGARLGLVAGAFAQIPYKDQLSFQVEVNYSQEGAQNRNYDFSEFSTVIYNQILKYNYLNIPLLFHYDYNDRINFQVGPQFGIRLAAKETRIIKSGTPAPSDQSAGTRVFNQRIKLIYPSICLGVEYQLMDKLHGQVRFFTSPFDNVKRNAGDSEGTYPLNLQLSLSYVLGNIE